MTTDIYGQFEKLKLDSDNNSIKMVLIDDQNQTIEIHFSKQKRVELLSQIQNNCFNARQEYKNYIRIQNATEARKEADLRKKISEATSKDFQIELKKQLNIMLEKKTRSKER